MGELGQQKKDEISNLTCRDTLKSEQGREMEIHIPPPPPLLLLLLLLFLHGCPISDNVQSPEEEGGKGRSSYGSKFRSVRRGRGRGWSHILREEEGGRGSRIWVGRKKEWEGEKRTIREGKLTFGPFFAATAFSSSSSPLFAIAPPPA